LHFIVYELKPTIDSSYRTLPDREHTGIGGGSRHGLFAMYSALFGTFTQVINDYRKK